MLRYLRLNCLIIFTLAHLQLRLINILRWLIMPGLEPSLFPAASIWFEIWGLEKFLNDLFF